MSEDKQTLITVTAEQVKKAAINNHVSFIRHHQCGGCESWVGFEIQDDKLFFDSNCDCSSYRGPIEPRDWDSLSEWVNMQTTGKGQRFILSQLKL
jgi:hypothetical protein